MSLSLIDWGPAKSRIASPMTQNSSVKASPTRSEFLPKKSPFSKNERILSSSLLFLPPLFSSLLPLFPLFLPLPSIQNTEALTIDRRRRLQSRSLLLSLHNSLHKILEIRPNPLLYPPHYSRHRRHRRDLYRQVRTTSHQRVRRCLNYRRGNYFLCQNRTGIWRAGETWGII